MSSDRFATLRRAERLHRRRHPPQRDPPPPQRRLDMLATKRDKIAEEAWNIPVKLRYYTVCDWDAARCITKICERKMTKTTDSCRN